MASNLLLPRLTRPILPSFTLNARFFSTSNSISATRITNGSSSTRPISAFRTTAALTSILGVQIYFSRQKVLMDVGNGAALSSGGGLGDRLGDNIRQYSQNARNPVVDERGRMNPRIFRQISSGSILGLTTGLLLSFFSTSLAVLLGLSVFGLQILERKGISIIPYGRIQSYFKNIDVKRSMVDNVAFKLAFGVTCALSGFASF